MPFTVFPIPTTPLSSLSAASLSNGVTGTGEIVLQDAPEIHFPTITGTLTHSGGFAYLGQFNSSSFPNTGIGTAFSWNFTGGAGEVDIWNTFVVASPTNDNASFIFKQMTGTGTANTIATIYDVGRIDATMFTAGGVFAAATQFMLSETLATSAGAAQAVMERTEANTPGVGAENQIDIGLHRTGGSGDRYQVQAQIDTIVGGTNQNIVGWNGLAWAKKDGAAYEMSAFGGILACKVDAGLSNINAVALELDMDVRANIDRKIALQIVDEATSIGAGTFYDAGIVVGSQVGGARGFNYALQFGFNLSAAASEIRNAFLYCPTGTIPYAVDFSGVTFSTAAWKGNFTASGFVGTGTVTVAALPAAAAGNQGFRTMVSNSNATMTAGIGAVVAGGGANVVPVYSDGTNWRIG